MPTYQLLTDRTLAQSSAITPTTLIHIVYTGDPSQNIAGSSYKAELGQLAVLFSGGSDTLVTGGTYSNGTAIFTNNTGGTFNVTGFTTGNTLQQVLVNGNNSNGNNIIMSESDNIIFKYAGYNNNINTNTLTSNRVILFPDNSGTVALLSDIQTFTGGTVSGSTNFTNGLTANTISATTYQNLPVSALTAGTNISITNTSGNHTISVTGITGGSTFTGGTVSGATNFTNGLTANTISATTYQNLPPKEVFYKSHSSTSNLVYFGGFIEPTYDNGMNPVFISGIIPYDFGTHISSDIFLISTVSETQTVQLGFSSGSFGISCSATTGYTTFSKSYTQGVIDTINVDNFFSGITANQVFSTVIGDNGADKLVIGIKFKYYPI